jgi:6-phosphogluconolactonase
VEHELREFADDELLAQSAAAFVAVRARQAVANKGNFTFAVSGGKTPWAMFNELSAYHMPWAHTVIYQVDERVAPEGDPDRNLTNLIASLVNAQSQPLIMPMPVNVEDLEAGAREYGATLPAKIDMVHLGLGPDGHTASLIPGDPVLDVTDRMVAITEPYQGHRRMTLTYPALERAEQILWLVAGEDKREPLSKLLNGDTSIPAGRVAAMRSLVMTDKAAM